MKWTNTTLSFFFFLFMASTAFSQDCEFTLELFDSYGDGWNDASIDVEIDGIVTNYFLPDPDGFENDVFYASYTILVSGSASVSITYYSGLYDAEVTYSLTGPIGVVFQDGPFPEIESPFIGEMICPSCAAPVLSNVNISNIEAYTADIAWQINLDDNITYTLEYGDIGFEQGTGVVVAISDTTYNFSNLTQNTTYEVYFSFICPDGNNYVFSQPYTFTTLIAIDLGIVGVTNPLSGCNLSTMNLIQVEIHNYGTIPQSFVPFNFTINGTPGGVSHPIDGIYTGVLGIDSTDVMDFDMNYDFSEYGEYEIIAWTEMEGDAVLSNDTFNFTIVNKPLISDFPSYQDFESGIFSGWSLSSEGQNNSFDFGQPEGSIISSAAGGQNAWVTNLSGSYLSNELSYLESGCFDFSSMVEDPIFDFSLFIDAESTYDGMWLESSVDGGVNWVKVGTSNNDPSYLNWYNQVSLTYGDWWSGNVSSSEIGFSYVFDFANWVTARAVLSGVAGLDDVRLRFVFVSDSSVEYEGFGVDNIYIHSVLANDLSVFSGQTTDDEFCGSAAANVMVSLFNHGQNPISNITVNYQIDDGTIVTENAAGLTLQPGEQAIYTFFTPFSSIGLNGYTITIWVDGGDDNAANDIIAIQTAANILTIPASEDFEAGSLPSNWSTTGYFAVPLEHNNPSFNVSKNIFSSVPEFTTTTPYFGEIGENVVFSFDYRFGNYNDGGLTGAELAGDNMQIQVAPYCTEDYTTIYTIDASNHVTTPDYTNLSIDLTEYAGENLSFRFIATWESGDYWVDIDNINIAGVVSANDIELVKGVSLSPNPTSGVATLNVEFIESVDAKIMVSNLLGQEVITINKKNVRQGEYRLDLTNQPDGLYFVSIHAGNTVKTVKLIKS